MQVTPAGVWKGGTWRDKSYCRACSARLPQRVIGDGFSVISVPVEPRWFRSRPAFLLLLVIERLRSSPCITYQQDNEAPPKNYPLYKCFGRLRYGIIGTKEHNGYAYVGIDIGSLSTDAVILVGDEIVSYAIVPTLSSSEVAAKLAYENALASAGIAAEDVQTVVATGYGRASIDFASRTVTEITCHALGARKLFSQAKTVIDIGGQDSKVIKLSEDGLFEDFAMNDKCAAGTGRFLEVMARSLDTNLESLGRLSALSQSDVRVSSTCTVFAESEVVALVAAGVPKEDIIRGLHRSVAERVFAMVARLRAKGPYVMTGGVAKNTGVVAALEERLGEKLLVPPEPQIVGALGAAIVAARGE